MAARTSTRQAIRCGASAGAVGAAIMVAAQAIARLTAGVPMIPDLFVDTATWAIPPSVFSTVLDLLKFNAKPLLFIALLILQVLIGVVIGVVFSVIWRRQSGEARGQRNRWGTALLGAMVLWLLTGLALLPLAGKGLFGSATAVGAIGLNLALLPSFLLFGIALAGTYRVLILSLPPAVEPTGEVAGEPVPNPERRRLLGSVVVGIVAIVALGVVNRVLSTGHAAADPGAKPTSPTQPTGAAITDPVETPALPARPSGEWTIPGLTPEVTPTSDFYKVSKNFFSDPVLNQSGWRLEVNGAVKLPQSLAYSDLLERPAIERYQTLECISNEVGGDLISNASWRGISLRDLILAAEPDPRVVKAVFHAADGYTDSIRIDRALSPENLLAYAMNGASLEPDHGAPARLLIPGIYGMKNVKWLTRIELAIDDVKGYWQVRGWSDDASINLMARIDIPRAGASLAAGRTELAGIAFGGDQGISKVEVSLDGGKSWQAAVLKDPLGNFTWRLWRLDWDAQPGRYDLVVRAIDGNGRAQTEVIADPLPDGATGWHKRSVQVT